MNSKETTALLGDLVSIPSINPLGRELPPEVTYETRVTEYLENFFLRLGVPFERQPVAPGRENIVARWNNPASDRTILFEAHQDTVPVDGMVIPPFEPRIDGGKLYGRGSCDIKGGMTSMLSAFTRVVREKPAKAANLIMACTVDEEDTMLGVLELVKRGVQADFAVVAEPTRLNIVHAHKGVTRWKIRTPGRSCHSSAPEQGTNAIYRMGRILTGIEKFAAELSMSRLDPLLGPPTISVGVINGGVSVNTVPDACEIQIDRRLIGGEDPLAPPEALKTYLVEKAGIDFPFESTPPWIKLPALVPTNADEAIRTLGRAIDRIRNGHRVHSVPFGTDAATLSSAGIPSLIFGPGDIAQAHTKDEWVPLDEVMQAAEILYTLAVG